MAQLGIRDYLKQRYGVGDDDITYQNGTVMLKGKRYMNATPQADGKTYADANQLDMSDNSYNMRDAIETYRQNAMKPVQPFTYDPNTDPQYQSALEQARRNTQTAAGNIAADMNKRGLLNSTITADRGNQAAQQEYGRVSAEVLPQLISQKYMQYRDSINQQNQQNQALLTYAEALDRQKQQAFANERTLNQEARQRQQDHIVLANQLSQEFGVQVDPKDDPALAYAQVQGLTPLSMQQFLQNKAVQEAGLTGMYDDAPTLQKQNQDFSNYMDQQQLGVSQMNAATSATSAENASSNAAFNRIMDIWRSTGKAPAGIPGVPEGTPLYDEVSARQGNNGKPYDEVYLRAIEAAQRDDKYRTSLDDNVRQQIIDYYYNLLKKQTPEAVSDDDIKQYLK